MEKHKKIYTISSFEVDQNAKLRLHSLFNLLQDIADDHAEKIGVGYSFCRENGVGWVGSAYHLQIYRLPGWNEKIRIETWPSASTAASAIRDFQVFGADETVLINATSQWVLIDTARMRPLPIAKHLPHYGVYEERAFCSDFSKIPDSEGSFNKTIFPVHADDIDLNHHVNNALYPTWVLDSFDDGYLKTHFPSEIKILFRRSAKREDRICLKTYHNDSKTVSLLTNEDGSVEFARIQINWQNLK